MQPKTSGHTDTVNGEGLLTDGERAHRLEHAFGWAAAVLWRGKHLIAGLTLAGAITAVVISLLLPNWYQSTARLLLPDSSMPGVGALLGNLSPQAARLLGAGASGDYSRYLAILTSDSMADRVIEEFGLLDVYQRRNSSRPLTSTRRELSKNTSFDVDMQFDFMTISVRDRDRNRAAAMANFYVDELNRRNAQLSAQNAANYRRYVEMRYNEVVARLDSAQLAMQRLQEEMGVMELPSTAEAFLRGFAEQRADVVKLEIQHGALLRQYGPENPRVVAARDALLAARSAERAALQGGEPLFPIGMAELPAAANRYAVVYRDVLMQTELLKMAQPLYEQARFEEEREKVAVQVVDRAQPPEAKIFPHRAFIVVGTALSVFMLSVLLVLALAWSRRSDNWLRRALSYTATTE